MQVKQAILDMPKERSVPIFRETLIMLLFRHYTATFHGMKSLKWAITTLPFGVVRSVTCDKEAPVAVITNGRVPMERKVYLLLQALSDSQLAALFATLVKPKAAYLEAAGLPEDLAVRVQFGDKVPDKTLRYFVGKGILPAQAEALAQSWWGMKDSVKSMADRVERPPDRLMMTEQAEVTV